MEKIKYKEIGYNDFLIIKNDSKINMDHYTGFLFHGSRRGMIDEGSKELSLFFKENDIYMSYLKNNIHSILDEMGISYDDRYKKIKYLYRVDMYKNVSNFEYGDFYLSTDYLTAIIFSNFNAGELCEVAYLIALDIRKMNIVFKDEEINNIMDRIIQKHEKYGNTERVILAVQNVEFDDLRTEGGYNCDDFLKEELYECYTKINSNYSLNVRINNLSKYTFYLISEKEFLKFIPLFTDIKENEVINLKDDYMYQHLKFLFE